MRYLCEICGLEPSALGWNRHCEERSDEAIQRTWMPYVPWIASLRSQ